MDREKSINFITGIIATMFFYAAVSKLSDYKSAHEAMRNQIFTNIVADILTWLIPTIELLLTVLLIYKPTRRFGIRLSIYLLTTFTIYILVVMTKAFGRIPCSCGGIISQLGYKWHILFNLFFLIAGWIGLNILKKIHN